MKSSLLLSLVGSHLLGAVNSVSCNYGALNGIFYPEGECGFFVDVDSGSQEAYMVTCDYSSGAQAYAHEFSTSDCSGSVLNTTALDNFYCCETCTDECDSLYFAAVEYGNDSDSSTCDETTGTVRGYWEYNLYAGPGSEECLPDGSGISGFASLATYGAHSFRVDFFLNNDCSGTPFAIFDFEQGCNFMDVYNGYVNAEIEYISATPSSSTDTPTLPPTSVGPDTTSITFTTIAPVVSTNSGGTGGTGGSGTTSSPTVVIDNPDVGSHCRFGAYGGTLFPAGYCSIPYSPYGNESSWEVICIGDQGYLNQYSSLVLILFVFFKLLKNNKHVANAKLRICFSQTQAFLFV